MRCRENAFVCWPSVPSHNANPALLPHLARVAHEARETKGFKYAHIAGRVRKPDGTLGVSESTISRFERGSSWPQDPDAIVAAYGQVLGLSTCELWMRVLRALLADCP